MPADPAPDDQPRSSFFARLREKLSPTRALDAALDWLPGRQLDDAMVEELETGLLLADVGVDAAADIIERLRKSAARQRITTTSDARDALQAAIVGILTPHSQPLRIPQQPRPFLILMVGVNGAGKTTTIGKLARRFRDQGLSVLLAAGDTFRAAAVEQLQVWGQRNDVPVVAQQAGADPAAVIFDAFQAAQARGIDVVLADTAGRLQNKAHLMQELSKVVRVLRKLDPAAPHEVMLVLDASQGQNAVSQAVQFNEAVGITGITMTKLDAGGRGGVLLAIAKRLDVPFRFIGVGEQAADMDEFRADEFAAALLKAPS